MRTKSLWVVLGALVLGGCGSGDADKQQEGAVSTLERTIRQQLPGKLRQSTGQAVFVSGVRCVGAGGSRYDCIAKVSGYDDLGKRVTEDVGVTGTCDKRNCIWRTQQ